MSYWLIPLLAHLSFRRTIPLSKIAWASVFCQTFFVNVRIPQYLNSMSPCPFLHVHVSMSMSPCLCLHVYVSMSSFFQVSMSHVYVSMFSCLHLHVSMFPAFLKQKTELMENCNFHLFAANRKRKWQTSVSFLQTETEKRKFVFSWSANDKW